MSQAHKGETLGLRARRTNPGELDTYRLASSIRLPWGIGLAALLILAVTVAVLVGRTGESTLRVPQVVLDYQEQIARDGAQSVRRSLNEGVSDLDDLARLLTTTNVTSQAGIQAVLREFSRSQNRYVSLYAVDGHGTVLARVGAPPSRRGLQAALAGQPGIREVPQPNGKGAVIQQFAPVAASQTAVRALIAHYNPMFMQYPLDVSRPGYAWVVNSRGQAVGARGTRALLGPLPRLSLRQAAGRAISNVSGARSVGGSLDTQEVVGYAPVTGAGPAGKLGWGIVASRSVSSFSLPQTEARRQAVLAGAVLVVITLLIFGWLYIVVLAPVVRLQREAERLAYGDLGKSVDVIRYDEIGLIGRALERVRIGLIRNRVKSSSGSTATPANRTRPERATGAGRFSRPESVDAEDSPTGNGKPETERGRSRIP
jgi:hypothetical protein